MPGFTFTLCAMPGQTSGAAAAGLPLGHMAWSVGPGPALASRSVGLSMRGGVMVLSDAGFAETGQRADLAAVGALVREALSEMNRRGFTGLLCDFEQRRSAALETLIGELAPALRRQGRTLYIPERYAHCGEACVLISTAITQGSLAGRLREAAGRYGGPDRLFLDVECLRLDITLPSPGNMGRRLSRAELEDLLRERGGQSFLSEELCARYFTYRKADEHHFVIFDDGSTLQKKAQTAARAGLAGGFVLYPEVEGWLSSL
ncbi:MAG: hypothetical protein FWG93_04625 [Oscillospiraceae bacterium]|nr:hypothetical protein [Oscillospiraceae bacterium]